MTLATTTMRLGGLFTRYELLERIGVGGMAEVFRAHGITKSGAIRPVVVKKILPHLSGDEKFRTMFIDEARILSLLDHANIVKILDVGHMDDDLFLAMEFVDGCDLLRLVAAFDEAGRRLQVPLAIQVVIEVLKALQHAHTRTDPGDGSPLSIVHRDVTPANVLASLDGKVKLTDFGIARAEARQTATSVGVVKGNVLYIAPEQLSNAGVDARTDVYGAGMLFHRLLAGRHAFQGEPLPKVYQRALSGDIPPPSSFNPSVPTNLDAIVAQAIQRIPGERFQSADEFRAALEDYAERKGWALDPAALGAEVAFVRSAAAAPAEPSIVGRLMPLISDAVKSTSGGSGDVSVFRSSGNRPAPRLSPEPSTSANPTRPKYTEPEDVPTTTSTHESEPADLPTITNPSSDLLSRPTTKQVKVSSQVETVPSGKPLIDDDETEYAEPPPERTERQVRVPSPPPSPPSARGAEPTAATPRFRARSHQDAVSAIGAVQWGGRFAATGSHDQTLRIWDLVDFKDVRVCRGHGGALTSIALFREGMRILTSSADETIRLWATEDGRCLARMRGHTGWVNAVAASPDGSTAISAGFDKTLRIWDVGEGSEIFVCRSGDAPVTAVSFLGEGALAVSASRDRALRLWNVLDGNLVGTFDTKLEGLRSMAITPDGRLAVLGGGKGMVQVWDLDKGREARMLLAEGTVTAVATTPDGRIAAVGHEQGVVRLWDLTTGALVRAFQAHAASSVQSLCVVLDGSALVTGASDGSLALWDL